MIDFLDISYLAKGNSKQRLAYTILRKHSILDILQDYSPIVVGTIPIEIDIESSDIDIICEVSDFKIFDTLITSHFSSYKNFVSDSNENRYVASFLIDELIIDIYAERNPSQNQNAYLHMLIEDRLLNLLGKDFRKQIIELKQKGYKTEPAFGYILGFKNPYSELLELTAISNEELLSRFSGLIDK